MSTLSKRAWALDLLGLDANATVDEIKTAYRDLVSIWHPDKHQINARNLKRAEEMMKRLNAAREVLINNGEIPLEWANERVRPKYEEPKQEEQTQDWQREENDQKSDSKAEEVFWESEPPPDEDIFDTNKSLMLRILQRLKKIKIKVGHLIGEPLDIQMMILVVLFYGTCGYYAYNFFFGSGKEPTTRGQYLEPKGKSNRSQSTTMTENDQYENGGPIKRFMTKYGSFGIELTPEEVKIFSSEDVYAKQQLTNRIVDDMEQGLARDKRFKPVR